VRIAQDVAKGSLNGAISAYMETAFPRRFNRDLGYIQPIQYIERCIGVESGLIPQFHAAIANIEGVNIPGGMSAGLSTIVGGSAVPFTGSTPLPKPPPPGGTAFPPGGPGIIQPPTPHICGGTGIDPVLSGSIKSIVDSWIALPLGEKQKLVCGPPNRIDINGAENWVIGYATDCAGGSVPVYYACAVDGFPAVAGGVQVDTGTLTSYPVENIKCGSAGTPPIPESPPTAPCPPPPCVPICKPTCESELPEQKKCEYRVWKTVEGVCYIQPADKPPRSGDDTLILSGEPGSGWIEKLVEACRAKPKPGAEAPEVSPIGATIMGLLGCAEFGAVPGINLPNGLADASVLFGLRKPDGTLVLPFDGAASFTPSGILGNAAAGFGIQILDWIAKLVQSVATQSGCSSGQQTALMAASTLLGFARNFTGSALDLIAIPIQQQSNFLCPVVLPDKNEATAAWLANAIDEATLECWVRACGARFPEHKTVIEAARRKLSPLDVATLRRRTEIDEVEYARRIREMGFIRQTDGSDIYKLSQQIPPASDIVRMMVRDADDDNLAQTFGLDDQFGAKFQQQLKKWTTDQGIDEKYMRYLWRAHWSIPAPGQLFEMLHRLSRLPAGDPAYVTSQNIRDALTQQDIAPFWIDKFLAISYRPLTRIDAGRAFRMGVLPKKELADTYLDLGYNQANADRLADFNEQQRRLAILRLPIVKQFAAGELSRPDFMQLVTDNGGSADDADAAVGRAAIIRRAESRKRCIAAYRKRYLVGEYDYGDSVGRLVNQGVDSADAQVIVQGWKCERDARGKEFSSSQLCEFLEAGFITPAEFVRRLQRLDWGYDDAVMVLRACQRRLGIKMLNREASELKKAQAAADKLTRQLKQQEAEINAAAARKQAAGNKLVSANTMRNKRLLEAAKNFAKHSGEEWPDSVFYTKELYKKIRDEQLYRPDEIVAAIVTASQVTTIKDRAEFATQVARALEGITEAATNGFYAGR
jgi:hypothetical protein